MDTTSRIIKIEELEIGDEIIVPSNGHLRYYKVLRKPKMTSKTTKYSKGALINKWSGVRCSTNMITTEGKRTWRKPPHDVYNIYTYICTPDNHNTEKMVYTLQYSNMWLVKREKP